MRVGMLCIGDELLDGRTKEVNVQAAGEALSTLGLELEFAAIVGDGLESIQDALNDASERAQVVIVSGGLGPTADDITREAAAMLLGVELEPDEAALELLRARFKARGYIVTGNNERQCLFPRGAKVILNEVGSASGFAMTHQETTFYFVPGVPRECRWFLEGPITQALQDQAQGAWPLRRRFEVFGLPESHVEQRLDGIEALAKDVEGKVAYCARFPIIEVTLKARTDAALTMMEELVIERLEDWLVGDDTEDLRARIGRLLIEQEATVTTAESCTAGGIAAALTDTGGSSAWFDMGWVTYSNVAKQELVGVDGATLEAFGAVSAQVVAQMADGARARADATYALAVSGIAGPGGGSPNKPVGTVWFALSSPEGAYLHLGRFEHRTRAQVRELAVYTALTLLLWRLELKLDAHPEVKGPYPIEQIWDQEGLSLSPDEAP